MYLLRGVSPDMYVPLTLRDVEAGRGCVAFVPRGSRGGRCRRARAGGAVPGAVPGAVLAGQVVLRVASGRTRHPVQRGPPRGYVGRSGVRGRRLRGCGLRRRVSIHIW